MPDELELWQDRPQPCPDPDCAGLGQPDGDAELFFYACDHCGYEFGYQRLDQLGFLQWPCYDKNHPGTDIVHKDGNFLRGKAKLTVTPQVAELYREVAA